MATQTIVFHKLAVLAALEQRGFSRTQAEGIAETVNDIALAQLVTKAEFHQGLADLKFEILKYMVTGMAAQTALIVAMVELLK